MLSTASNSMAYKIQKYIEMEEKYIAELEEEEEFVEMEDCASLSLEF